MALQKLPVVLCFDRAGLVGEDGATHQGAFDLAAYRSIPGTVVSAPRNELELKNLMHTALSAGEGPFIIRYPRGCGEGVQWKETVPTILPIGKGEKLMDGKRVAVLALGPVVNRALEAACRHKADYWVSPAVFDMRFLKPLDESIMEEAAGYEVILTVEDGCLKGGLFGAVSEWFAGKANAPLIKGLGIPDCFVEQASQATQRKECCLDAESIYSLLYEMMKN